MFRRFLDALHRELADQAPPRPLRPNELTRELARAERLRQAPRQPAPGPPPAAEPPSRDRPAAAPRPAAAAPLAAALRSRSELRRAMLLKEILGPPAALRWPRAGDFDR